MKTKLNTDSIWNFQYTHKLKIKDFILLAEAYRRKHFLYTNSEKFYGLGTPSCYKSDLFTPSFREVKRASNWYTLTGKGQKLLTEMENYFTIPEDLKKRDEMNLFIYSL